VGRAPGFYGVEFHNSVLITNPWGQGFLPWLGKFIQGWKLVQKCWSDLMIKLLFLIQLMGAKLDWSCISHQQTNFKIGIWQTSAGWDLNLSYSFGQEHSLSYSSGA